MADVFVSYASQDREQARRLQTALQQHGWSVWWDRSLPVGTDFALHIEQELNTALSVLVLWSRSSIDSTWVRNEARVALKRAVLRPLLIEEVTSPLEFQHLHTLNLADWDGAPTHEAFRGLVRDLEQLLPPRIAQLKEPLFHSLKDSQRRIGVLAGSSVNDIPASIDVWVVPTNTDLRLPDFHDRSMSAQVRYFGSRRSPTGRVIEDTIGYELAFAAGGETLVPPGAVLVTPPGQLAERGVKRIYHVAALYGVIGRGYQLVPDLAACVAAALEQTSSEEERQLGLRSIVLPILGPQTGDGLRSVLASQIHACIHYFEKNPASALSTVYFLASTDRQLNAYLSVIDEADLKAISLSDYKSN